MEQVRDLAKRVAPTETPVLIRGATGVGKGFLAKTIHRLSGRSGDFVVVNCDKIPADQIDVVLFGREAGAIRATPEPKRGSIEAAKGGTVFLRDIGSLPPVVQETLSRTIETKTALAVGATRPRPIDVRFIFSTSARTERTIGVDLIRLSSGVTLDIPPLRRRTDEIPKLVAIFVRDFSRESGRAQPPGVTRGAMDRLLRYPWPRNVGELEQVIRRALRLCDGPEISPEHLTVDMSAAFAWLADGAEPPAPQPRQAESRCSLCGQFASDVRKLINGPRVFICDRCVEEAQEIACAAPDRRQRDTGVEAPDDRSAACAFCGKSSREVSHLVGADAELICDECLNLCDEILGEWFPGPWPVGETVTLRTVYPAAAVDATISRAREQLGRRKPCRIVILVDDGKMDAARSLLDEVKGALAAVAHFWEQAAAFPEAALAVIALPRTGPDSPVA